MQTPEASRDKHTYPHQGHLESVSPGMLADDLIMHPEAYHPDLVACHIAPYLARNGIDLDGINFQEEEDEKRSLETQQKVKNWQEGDPLFSNDEAYSLIDGQYYGVIAGHLDRFTGLSRYIAEILIEAGFNLSVIRGVDAFIDLDENIALRLIENGYTREVMPRLEHFHGCTQETMASHLVANRQGRIVAANLDLFTNLSQNEIAHKILDVNHAILGDYIDSFHDLDATIAYELIDRRLVGPVMNYFDRYTGLDPNVVAHHLMDIGKSNIIARYIEQFDNLDSEIAEYLVREDYGGAVTAHLDCFKALDHQALAELMVSTCPIHLAFDYLERLHELDYNMLVQKMILRPLSVPLVMQGLDKLPGVDHGRLFDSLWELGYQSTIATYFNKFQGLDQQEVAEKLITSGHAFTLAKNLDKFPAVEHRVIAQKMIDAGYGHAILSEYDRFHDLGDEAALVTRVLEDDLTHISLLRSNVLDRIKDDPRLVSFLKDNVSQLFTNKDVLMYEDVADEAYARIVDIITANSNETTALNAELFGPMAGAVTAQMLHLLLRGDIVPEPMSNLGITQVGPEGIAQLRVLMAPIMQEINSVTISRETEQQIMDSELLQRLLMSYTGYTAGNWGRHDTYSLRSKLQYRKQAIEDGRINPEPPEGYEPSERYEIRTTGSKKERVEFTEDTVERYRALVGDIRNAAISLEEKKSFYEIILGLQRDIDIVIENLRTQLKEIDESEEKADMKRDNLNARIGSLEHYIESSRSGAGQRFVLNSPADFERGIIELARYPELHYGIRTLTFAWAMRKYPRTREGLMSLPDEPTIDSIAAVRDFIEHIVNQETYGEYFSDKKSSSVFKRITSTKALEEAMSRYNKQAAKGGNTTELQFIPTRGIMMEMSGQIADACWADRHDSIAEDKPNFTSLVMRARPGKANERIVGAAMLIETKNPKTGEGVLLLRGTNPTENYVNKVDVAGFYEAITDYVRKTAERRGLKPAIVIDDHSGGSGTNRPVLHGYLMAKMPSLKRQLVDGASTYFNGYNVTNDSYAL